jgi:4-diphosphocytidyl-2-C-methyl-D-erythritol kinase
VATIHRELAFAKLTRTLRVTGRRSDGYHLLSSEMVAVDLADEVYIDEDGEGMTLEDAIAWIVSEVSRPRFAVPAGRANLVAKALALCGRSAAVRLVKRIPAGAGLGGGSSDAAAVIRHFGGVSDVGAAVLGADVPFCIAGGRAHVSGIGDEIEQLPDESLHFVIVTPGFPVSTKAVYDAYDDLGAPAGEGSNDLEDAALFVEPRLVGLKRAISAAAGRAPELAGSGASYFLECSSFEQLGLAQKLTAALAGAVGPVVVSPCRSVARLQG